MDDEKNLVNSLIYFFLKMDLEYYSIDLNETAKIPYDDMLYDLIERTERIPKEKLINNLNEYCMEINKKILNIKISLINMKLIIKKA